MTTRNTGRILGIDYGSKRVGISISDPMRIIAQGVGTFENDARLLSRIQEIIKDQNVALILVGMPYNAAGEMGPKALEVESFINALKLVVDVGIETWDESFSSVEAKRVFIQGGMKKKKRQEKRRVDEMAARLLLQEYLQSQSS
ncbi:MAG: Holliday junction resolvase RuvX [Bacteroidota bacterium]